MPHSPHSFSLPPEVLQVEATVFTKDLPPYTRNEMGSTLLLHPVLATLPPKFIFTKISNPVHSSVGQAFKTPPPMDLAMSELQFN